LLKFPGLVLALLIWMGGLSKALPAQDTSSRLIAIVCSDSSEASERSLKGIRQSLREAEFTHQIIDLNLKTEGAEQIAQRITEARPDLIVSIGSPATLYLREQFPDLPIIFSTVLNPETSGLLAGPSGKNKNITGASLDIPVEIQFQKFMLVYPRLKKIGAIYTAQTEKLIKQAEKIAPRLNLELVAIKISADRDVPKALDSLFKVVDCIWTTADDLIYTPQATKFMILAALRHGIPIMGFSPSFVQSGALLGLNYDYKDVGRQAGELAIKYLHGKQALDSIPIATPGMIYLHINLKTAKQLGIEIDQSLVDVSKEIYK